MARLGVGLPVFNGERYLAEAVTSLLSQTFTDFELLICDNASSDETGSIARQFAAHDPRVRYHRNPTNLGAAANFNLAFHLTGGTYFKWLAADDVCRPPFLESCIDVLDRSADVVLAHPQAMIIDADGQEMGPYQLRLATDAPDPVTRFAALLKIHRCFEIFGVARRQVLATTPLVGSYAHADGVLLARLALRGRLREVAEPHLLARHHLDQSMSRYRGDYRRYATWFDPKLQGKRLFPFWRLHREHLRSIQEAPLSATERLRCLWHLARWTRLRRRELWQDLRTHLVGAGGGGR